MNSDLQKRGVFFIKMSLFIVVIGNNDRMNLEWKRMEVLETIHYNLFS